MNSNSIQEKLKEVKAEIKKLDSWFEYNHLADNVYFSMLRRKRELLVKKQQLQDRLDPRKQSAYLPDKIVIVNPLK